MISDSTCSDITFPIHVFEHQGPDGRIGRIHFNRPQHHHALNQTMCQIMDRALQKWDQCADIKGILFTSEGSQAFCAGGDVRACYSDWEPNRLLAFFHQSYNLIKRLHGFSKIKIGLCPGYILGGGLGHMMSYDIRLITPNAQLGMPEVKIAFFPDVGSRYFLPKYLSPAMARYLVLTGTCLSAHEALSLGLVDGVVDLYQLKKVTETVLTQPWQNASECMQTLKPYLSTSYKDKSIYQDNTLIESVFNQADYYQWQQALIKTPWLGQIQSYAPHSVHAIFHMMYHKASQQSIESACRTDAALAKMFIEQSDFKEGVRARLIDRGNPPHWNSALVDVQQLLDCMDQAIP